MVEKDQFLQDAEELDMEEIQDRLNKRNLVEDNFNNRERKNKEHSRKMTLESIKWITRIVIYIVVFTAFILLGICLLLHITGIYSFEFYDEILRAFEIIVTAIAGGGVFNFLDGKPIKILE